MNYGEKIAKIPSIYKVLAGLLFLTAVMVFFQKSPYIKQLEKNQASYSISFLQEGDYKLEVTYVGFQIGDKIQIFSKELIDESNHAGVLLAEYTVQQQAGVECIPFSLKNGTYCIDITTNAEEGCFTEGRIQSTGLQNRDNYFLSTIFIALSIGILYLGWKKPIIQDKIPVMLVIALGGILVSFPLFSDSLYIGDDTYFHLARIEGIYQAMRTGNFPVRLNAVQNSGYGDLSATMYPQLFLYPFALMRFLKISLMLCYKCLMLGINMAGAFIMYYSVKSICNSFRIGIWASILYTFAPYRLFDVYIRNAIGEALAMTFLPLIIWGTYEILWRDSKKWYILALGMTAVLQSHVLSTEMCVIFMVIELIVWLIFCSKRDIWKRVFDGIKAVGLTVLLNASFLIPFLYFSRQELQCFYMENYLDELPTYFTQMFSLFMSVVGKSVSTGSTKGEIALSVGVVLLFGTILFCINQIRSKTDDRTSKIGRRCMIYGALALLTSSWLFPWKELLDLEWFRKISSPLQFQWRLLSIATVFLSVVSAIAIENLLQDKILKYGLKFLVAGLTICSTCYCFDMLCQQSDSQSDKMGLEGNCWSDSMYLYYVTDAFETWHLQVSRENAVIKCVGDAEVIFSEYSKQGTNIEVTTANINGMEDILIFPLYYFSGYEILVNGERVETMDYANPQRYLACELPEGTAHITISYKGLPVFRAGDIISLVTIIVSLLFLIKENATISKSMRFWQNNRIDINI